jgi:hypothetical protein
MQVALQASPLGVAGRDDALTGGAKLLHLRPQFGGQPLVLQRHARRGRDRAEELALLAHAGVMDQGGDGPVLALNDADRSLGIIARQRDRPAARVGVDRPPRQPVGDLERPVSQRPGQRIAQPARLHAGSELEHQVGHRGTVQTAAKQPGKHRERHDAERADLGQDDRRRDPPP